MTSVSNSVYILVRRSTMSPDDIDSLIVEVVQQIEDELGDPDFFNDDDMYDRLVEIFYRHLEKFCTRDRNYN